MRNRSLSLLALTLIFCVSSGCDVTIGPKIGEKIVIVHEGQPVLVIQNVKATCQTLNGNATVSQDLGGWVAMPREHFEALKRAVEGAGDESPAEGPEVLHELPRNDAYAPARSEF